MTNIRDWLKHHAKTIVVLVLLMLCSFAVVGKSLQNDTFSAIADGNYILEHGLDDADHFTIHDNLKFIKYRWVFDIVVALIYDSFGFTGLWLFVVSLVFLIACVLFFACRAKTHNLYLSFALAAATLIICGNYLVMRAQIVSYVLLLLELSVIYFRDKFSKGQIAIILLALNLLLVSFHASVWIMFLTLLIPPIICLRERKFYFAILCAALVLGILSPLGIAPLKYPFEFMLSGVSREIILELRVSQLYYLTLFLPLFILLMIRAKRINRIYLMTFLYAVGLAAFSVLTERNAIIGAVCCPPLIGELIGDKPFSGCLLVDCSLALVCGCLCLFQIGYRSQEPFIDESVFPVAAADYLTDYFGTDGLRIYNDFNVGAYLDFRGISPFIDSRSEIFESAQEEKSIISDYRKFALNRDYKYIDTIIKKYQLNSLLLSKEQADEMKVLQQDRFAREYEDDYFVIYSIQN